MCHLGVELYSIERLFVMSNSCKGRSMRLSDNVEVLRHLRKLIAMGHPDLHIYVLNAPPMRETSSLTHLHFVSKGLE